MGSIDVRLEARVLRLELKVHVENSMGCGGQSWMIRVNKLVDNYVDDNQLIVSVLIQTNVSICCFPS